MQASSAHPLSRFINWLPLWLGLGVLAYFALPDEPAWWMPLVTLAAVAGCLFALRRRDALHIKKCLALFIVMLAGFSAAMWQTERVKTPFLQRPYFNVPITATVEDIEPKGKRHSMILKDITSTDIPAAQLPKQVKISVSLKDQVVEEDDRIQMKATLIPPSPPVMKGAFDFARYFYFRSVGAVGYAIPPVTILEQNTGNSWSDALLHRLAEYRQSLQHKILLNMPQPASGIAVALVTGSMDSVTDKANLALRNSSLSHMLSISGMHMVIVCGFIFFIVRLLLVMIPHLYIYINPKRWAAAVALLGGLFYLILADSPVPAVRAYVMIAVFLSASLFDREADALRSLALAAAAIMLIQPSALMEPSFQLSFVATLSLILAFRSAKSLYQRESVSGKSIFRQVAAHIAGSGFSSLVAGIATTPFIIYHFNQFVIYGVLANILAAPLLGFVITPALVVMLLMPEGWGLQWSAVVATRGLDWLVGIGTWVSSLPLASFYIPPIQGWELVLFLAAVVLLCVLGKWWKLVAVPLMLPMMIQLFITSVPDIMVSRDARALAIRDGSRFILLAGSTRHFTVSLWQQRLGMSFIEWRKLKDDMPDFLKCGEKECHVTLQNKNYFIGNIPPEDCSGIDGFMEFTLKREKQLPTIGKRVYPPMNLHCPGVPVIFNFWKIVKEGPLLVTAGNGLQIKTACNDAPKRPWVFYCSRGFSGKRKYPRDSNFFSTPSSPHK